MKKSIWIVILVFSLAALLAVGTWAWFTATAEPVVNQFAAGTVEIEIDEHGFQDITNWNPGNESTKQVSVKTLGSKCAYVRVSLTPVWGHLDGERFVAEPGLPVSNVLINWNEADWVYLAPVAPPEGPHPGEGWYYYKSILCPDDLETTLLLQSVSLSADTGNKYQGKVLRIVVNAEAVQASHDAYKDAWGLTALPAGVQEWVAP